MNRRIDIAIAVFFGAVGVGMVIVAQNLRRGTLADPLGVAGMPTMVGTFIALACGVLVARHGIAWVKARADGAPMPALPEGVPDEPGHPSSPARALGIAGLLLVYVYLLPTVGYLLLTAATLAIALWMMQVRRPVMLASLSVGFSVLTWFFFDYLLGVRLPQGWTSFLF